MTTTHTELQAPYGFHLSAAADFYAGFTPMGGAARQLGPRLQLAMRLDGTFEAFSAKLSQEGSRLDVELEGTADVATATNQLSRMLGLDADGRAWARIGEVDPVMGALQRQQPGFFTAGFPSPYEAGVGGVLSHRSSIAQAAALRRRLSEAHGTQVGGIFVLPSPQQLLHVKAFVGVAPQKLAVLHGLARAALDGRLEAKRLRALPVDEALASLQTLHGIGPWTANHMLLRGASLVDALPMAEPRVLRAFTLAYQRPERDFVRAAEAWRPFRMWACIVLVRNLARLGQFEAVPEDRVRRGKRALVAG
jgi:DNA-3-methyladenine glycosylase II